MARTFRKVAAWVKNCFFSEYTNKNRRELRLIDRKHQTATVNDGKAHGQFCDNGSYCDAVRTPGVKKFVKRLKRRHNRVVSKLECKHNEE